MSFHPKKWAGFFQFYLDCHRDPMGFLGDFLESRPLEGLKYHSLRPSKNDVFINPCESSLKQTAKATETQRLVQMSFSPFGGNFGLFSGGKLAVSFREGIVISPKNHSQLS